MEWEESVKGGGVIPLWRFTTSEAWGHLWWIKCQYYVSLSKEFMLTEGLCQIMPSCVPVNRDFQVHCIDVNRTVCIEYALLLVHSAVYGSSLPPRMAHPGWPTPAIVCYCCLHSVWEEEAGLTPAPHLTQATLAQLQIWGYTMTTINRSHNYYIHV